MNKFRWVAIGIVALCVVLWFIPSTMRDARAPFAGTSSYDDLALAKQWHGSFLIKAGTVDGGWRLLTPVHVLLAWTPDPLQALRIIGLISGVAGAYGLWLLMRKSNLPLRTTVVAIALYGVSTITIQLSANPTVGSVVVGLTLLAAGLAVQGSPVWKILAAALTLIISFCGPVAALNITVLLIAVLLWQHRPREILIYIVPVCAGAFSWWSIVGFTDLRWVMPVVGILWEFGAQPGVGVMGWIIALIGMGVIWPQTSRRILLTLGVVYASVSGVAAMYAAALWAVLGAAGVVYVYEREWRYPLLRTLSLFAIGCGLLLSTLGSVSGIINAQPSSAMVDGMQQLGAAHVLTYPAYADWVRQWSASSVVLDDHVLFPVVRQQQAAILGELWHTRDLANATRMLDTLGADTIVVTTAMRTGLVWSTEDEGFLFLLERSEMFKKSFSNSEIQVWELAPGRQ